MDLDIAIFNIQNIISRLYTVFTFNFGSEFLVSISVKKLNQSMHAHGLLIHEYTDLNTRIKVYFNYAHFNAVFIKSRSFVFVITY